MLMAMKFMLMSLLMGLGATGCGDDSGEDTTGGGDTTVASGSTGTSAPSESDGGEQTGTSGGGTASTTGSSGVVDDSSEGGESGAEGPFPCGDRLECSLATQYCQQTVGGAVGNPPSFMCLDLPEKCGGVQSCECLMSVPCAAICELIGGGVQVTCQAP